MRNSGSRATTGTARLTSLALAALICQLPAAALWSQTSKANSGIRITRPLADGDWEIGSSEEITWELAATDAEKITIELSRDSGWNWETLALLDPITATSWTWSPVTPPSTCTARIRLTATGPGWTCQDMTDGCFHVVQEEHLLDPVRVIEFGGALWGVRNESGLIPENPGMNYWSDSPDNVWVERRGNEEELHLRITSRSGKWFCCEVFTLEPTVYGIHRFYVSGRLDELDPLAVLGLFLYRDDCNEMDIEFSRWGYGAVCDNLQYSVQPGHVAGNTSSTLMRLYGVYTSHYLDWQAQRVKFASVHGRYSEPPNTCFCIPNPFGSFCMPFTDLCGWQYAGGDVPPVEKGLRIRMNLWLLEAEGHNAPMDGKEVEIVILGVDKPE